MHEIVQVNKPDSSSWKAIDEKWPELKQKNYHKTQL